MKKILIVLFSLLGQISSSFGGEVKTIVEIHNKGYKKSGNTVWFIKEKVIDSLICLPGQLGKCMVGSTTLHFADVYQLVGNVPDTALKRISVNRTLGTIPYPPTYQTKYSYLIGKEEKVVDICEIDHQRKIISFRENISEGTTNLYGLLTFTVCFFIFSLSNIFQDKISGIVRKVLLGSSLIIGLIDVIVCLILHENTSMPALLLVWGALVVVSMFGSLMDHSRDTNPLMLIWLGVFPFMVWLVTQNFNSSLITSAFCVPLILYRPFLFIKQWTRSKFAN